MGDVQFCYHNITGRFYKQQQQIASPKNSIFNRRGGEKMNRKEGNYFRIPNDIFGSGIEKRAFIVYCYLSRCSDMKTRQCYPSLKTIAKACNLSVTTVRRALTDLENGGWIDIAQRFTDNGQESNLYTVLNI